MSAIKFNLKLKDFHKAHKSRKNKPEETSTWPEFKLIVHTLGDILGDELVKTGRAHFPNIRWYLRMLKQKNNYTDKVASRQAGKRVKAFNDHSDGFACRIKLLIGSEDETKSKIFIFKGNRTLKRVKIPTAIRTNKSVIYNYLTVAERKIKPKSK
jgi:hypothetical protein